jgi:hypothetical protein
MAPASTRLAVPLRGNPPVDRSRSRNKTGRPIGRQRLRRRKETAQHRQERSPEESPGTEGSAVEQAGSDQSTAGARRALKRSTINHAPGHRRADRRVAQCALEAWHRQSGICSERHESSPGGGVGGMDTAPPGKYPDHRFLGERCCGDWLVEASFPHISASVGHG